MPKKAKEIEQFKHLELEQDQTSDLEFEDMLFENPSNTSKRSGIAPIITGFGILSSAALMILQGAGILPGSFFSNQILLFPIAGILLVLLFGLSPKRRRRRNRSKGRSRKSYATPSKTKSISPHRITADFSRRSKWNFPKKSRKKYIAGVCGGIAQKINMDPTLFRVLFMVALIATGGSVPLIAYILFAIFMPPPDDEDTI